MSEKFTTTLQEIALGEHAHIRARIGWRGLSSKEYIDNGGALLGAGNHISNGRFDWSRCDRITLERYEESPEIALREKDVVISKDGTIGRVAYIDNLPQIATINGTMMLVRVHSGQLDPHFVYHYLQSEKFQSLIQERVSGSSVPHIFQRDMVGLKMEIPPLPEQKKIAEILSGIDQLIWAMQRKVERIRTAQEGLSNSWQEWVSLEKEEGTLGDLIASIDSGWSPACDEVPPKSGEWGVLKVSAVTKGYFCEEESKRLPSDLHPREQFLVKKNDVLITRANGNLDYVGRGAIVEDEPAANLLMSDKILRLNPNSHSDRNFLLLLLNSRHVRQQIETAVGGSTGAKNIGQGLLRQISTPVPISEDQTMFGNLSRSLSATLSVEKKRLDYLFSLKKGLSADLLSGRKRVSV